MIGLLYMNVIQYSDTRKTYLITFMYSYMCIGNTDFIFIAGLIKPEIE